MNDLPNRLRDWDLAVRQLIDQAEARLAEGSTLAHELYRSGRIRAKTLLGPIISVQPYDPGCGPEDSGQATQAVLLVPQGHGITDFDVRNLPPFDAYARRLASFLEGADLAGYNLAEFDLPILAREFERCGVSVALGTLFIVFATFNQKALNLFGLITLSPEGARWLFWAVAVFFLAVLLPYSLAIAWKGMVANQRIAFLQDGILLPCSLYARTHVVVPYTELLDVQELVRANSRVIELSLRDRKFWIGLSWLDSAATFDEILVRLKASMAKAKVQDAEKRAAADGGA